MDKALRRAHLWALPADDLYGFVFRRSHDLSGLTWTMQSRQLLADSGVLDWPEWSVSCPTGSMECYKAYVKSTLSALFCSNWRLDVSRHRRPVPYISLFQAPCQHLQQALALNLSWQCMLGQRSLSRFRAALFNLGHRNGKRSTAQNQECIFCNESSGEIDVHVWSACGRYDSLRASVTMALGPHCWSNRGLVAKCLTIGPHDLGYTEVCLLALAIDRDECRFWSVQVH